ncbi:hypothetical protein E0Z10_g6154 [Xylaria hypoxylon]|uniref:Kelch repeat protein n=1 Tax=Xylaria hypoxylon TaxID=37992 RepID=A0A4Z0YW06_9PEZI|nr:hypothetical protein E0Z10_g6154 [Xylaria hypoxylon]
MKGRCYPFVLLAVWGALGKLGLARDLELVSRGDNNGSDIPSAHDFVRRGCHTVAVLGDYLYIDGGQITERVDGSAPADSPSYDGIHHHMLRSIPKKAPLLAKQVHWTDPSRGSLYTWGGFTSNDSSPSQALWQFTADGSGGGAWTQVTQRDYLNFSKLKGTFGSAFTQSKDENPGYATPGLVSYNFRTGSWDNTTTTTTSYGGYGTSLNARAEYAPFGPNGLLLFLGGAETPVDATNDSFVETSWNTISMVDPVTKKWHKQTTTGTKPLTIESHCSVGKKGPNGTYEIFLYGGVSDQIRATSPEVYVLSLPGFVFFKGPKDGPPRSDHQCAIVGQGQRQMLSMGGVAGENRTFTAPTTADPWTYGIGILDMTELKWTDSYNADAPDYDSPAIVKDWYDAGNLQDVHWDSEEIEDIFMREPTPTATHAPSTLGVGSPSTRVIVGGAVGGALGAAAIGMMSFLLIQRKRRARADTPDSRRGLAPTARDMEQIAEYKPEPWPKDYDGSPRYYSPDSLLSGATVQSPSISPQPHQTETRYAATHAIWRSELSGHQDGIVPVRGGELPGTEPRVGELMDPNMQWAYELPAPLESRRTELPDRKYSQ